MTDVHATLAKHLRGLASPVLFIGSGLSRRYAEADNWEGLLRHFAEMTPRSYEYYRAKADGDLPATAMAIAEPFYDIWWDSPQFKTSRDTYKDDLAGRESPLKVEVALYLSDLSERLPTTGVLADEVDLLRNAVVDAIITTNYDDILPSLFPEFKPFIGQDGLLFYNPQSVGELYQIHGSVRQPDSLVLTTTDYERFNERNTYLAAKLMTVFVEHPVLFLGYSLSDANVQSILLSIARCLTQDNVDQLRDRLIFIEWAEGTESSIVSHTFLIGDFAIPALRIKVPDFVAVFTVLSELLRRFPAQQLRRLKEQVYELVLTGDPHGRLVVADIDDTTPDREIDVVFGVGMREKLTSQGYTGLSRDDLIKDVLSNGSNYDARLIVDKTLPNILRTSAYVPVHKYLRAIGALDQDGTIKESADISSKIRNMANKIDHLYNSTAWIAKRAPDILADVNSVAELDAQGGPQGVLDYGVCMPENKVDASELRNYLNTTLREFLDTTRQSRRDNQWGETPYAKLVCYLDRLENGRSKPGQQSASESSATGGTTART